jgi:hypothetical protein
VIPLLPTPRDYRLYLESLGGTTDNSDPHRILVHLDGVWYKIERVLPSTRNVTEVHNSETKPTMYPSILSYTPDYRVISSEYSYDWY